MAYPPIEPYQTGLLDTGDGNRVYWETCGNPASVPVRRWKMTKDEVGSKTPQPGKRTILLRKRREPVRVRYWSLMSESTCPRYAAVMIAAADW